MNGHGDGNGNGNGNGGFSGVEWDYIRRHHRHEPADNQCSSALVKHIKAPVHLVNSIFLSLSVYVYAYVDWGIDMEIC